MESTGRLQAICELLLGAAYADKEFHEREKKVIISRLTELLGEKKLTPELDATIEAFDANSFDLAKSCSLFVGDLESEKKNLLALIAAVHDADDVYDFAEDDYLRSVAKQLKLEDEALKGLAIEYEVEAMSKKLRTIAKPPPLPAK